MSNKSLTTKHPLYPHSSSMNHHLDEQISPPYADSGVSQQSVNTTAATIQAVLGVFCYAGGLFALAWWQLAHPSFIFVILGAFLIIVGAKLFIFPKQYFLTNQESKAIFMNAMAEYLNPRNMDFDQDASIAPKSNKRENQDYFHDFLMPYKL